MSEYLGFEPNRENPYFFISYNTEDKERVQKIAAELHRRGCPLWYDYGIPYDTKWPEIIEKQIDECQAVLLFFSEGILSKPDSFVIKEYDIARICEKHIYIILLDNISAKDAPYGKKMWLNSLLNNQVIPAHRLSFDEIITETERAISQEGIIYRTDSFSIVDSEQSLPGSAAKPAGDSIAIVSDHKISNFSMNTAVGDFIQFGSYPQGENGEVRPIEWQVLAREGNSALIISRYGLDCKQYNEARGDITWAECTLRTWLNQDFLQLAFNEEEQEIIEKRTVHTMDNPHTGSKGGADTEDKVFLLSTEEAYEYFAGKRSRICQPTEYAEACGAYADENAGETWWWLRSPGCEQDYAASILTDGSVFARLTSVDEESLAVRPAMWIKIESENSEFADIDSLASAWID